MTAERLRAIATRIETQCIELRTVRRMSSVACDGCKADARDLREYALKLERAALSEALEPNWQNATKQ